ncbi:MAG: RibD family protein [Chloroflexota bacterium]|nr:RibD family protein [Dehalococcoidia bacterium]MDW8253201.1 RibD family protein [Chloroflexota bacterium]
MIEHVRAALDRAPEQYRTTGRPFVTLTYAQSVDGSITTRRGERLQLSNERSARFTHQLRALHDAILVGVGTVVDDDPQLTVRLVPGRDPQVVVVDSQLRVPISANIFRNERRPWLATTAAADARRVIELEEAGAQTFRLPATDNGWVNLRALLEQLGALGVRTLMVEGGSRIITSFLLANLVDQVIITVAPVLVGGLRAVEALIPFDGPAPLRLRNVAVEVCDDDVLIRGDLGSLPR